MDRITDKHLQAVVDRINRITGSPMQPYAFTNDRHVVQVGNFHLSHAYGGVCLHRMYNTGGGVSAPICGAIRLDSGGWRTVTTKLAMNQASNQDRLGFQVAQRKGEWFVTWKGTELPFTDGMVLS